MSPVRGVSWGSLGQERANWLSRAWGKVWAAFAICFNRIEYVHHDPDCRCSARLPKGLPTSLCQDLQYLLDALDEVRAVTALIETQAWSYRPP